MSDEAWKDTFIPEDIRNEKLFEQYPDTKEGLQNVLKTALHSHKKIGDNPLKRITPESSEEEKREFFKAIGAGEKEEDYTFSDSSLSEDQKKEIRKIAFDKGLTIEQAEAFHSYLSETEKTKKESLAKQKELARTQLEHKLKEEFGDTYNSKMSVLQSAVEFGGDYIKQVMESDLGSDYNLVMSLLKFGELLVEDVKPSEHGFKFTGGMSYEAAARKVESLKKDPDFQKRLFSKDAMALKEWQDSLMARAKAKESAPSE